MKGKLLIIKRVSAFPGEAIVEIVDNRRANGGFARVNALHGMTGDGWRVDARVARPPVDHVAIGLQRNQGIRRRRDRW